MAERVGAVALVLGSSAGGLGRHVLTLVEGMVALGIRVDVYCPAATEARYGYTAAGAAVTQVAIPSGSPDVAGLRRLHRALHAQPPDVVHAHGLRAGLAASLARPDAVPLVVTWHTPADASGAPRVARHLLARRVARVADVTIAVSPGIAAEATALGAADVRTVMAVAPALPVPTHDRAALGAELGLPPAAPLILSVGRLHPAKRHDVLIEAAARWRSRRPVPAVVIAGTGPAYRELVGLAAVGRAPVTLVGHRADVADLLAAAEIAVVTSAAEGSPLFVQEALVAGVPLVATAVAGVADLVGPDAAVLVPVGDVDALDAAVQGLLDDASRRASLAAAGRQRSVTWLTPREAFDQVMAVYASVAPAGGRRPAAPANPANPAITP